MRPSRNSHARLKVLASHEKRRMFARLKAAPQEEVDDAVENGDGNPSRATPMESAALPTVEITLSLRHKQKVIVMWSIFAVALLFTTALGLQGIPLSLASKLPSAPPSPVLPPLLPMLPTPSSPHPLSPPCRPTPSSHSPSPPSQPPSKPPSQPPSAPSSSALLPHTGLECRSDCEHRGGACSGYCGVKGACCRLGDDNDNFECAHGTLGCEGHHCCTLSARHRLPYAPPSHSAPSMPPAPPPFMPPAQPSMARDVVIALNARYRAGHASNVLAEAGVLVHVFDQLEDWGNDRGYRPCRSGWCNGRFDHESCSVINIHLPAIYPHHSSDGGVVLASSVPVACSFPGDGGTQKKTIEQLCNRTQCSPQERGLPHSQCSFGPNQLGDMLRAHQSRKGGVPYNEVVVSSRTWEERLPWSVEAFIDGGRAAAAHRSFLRDFPDRRGRTPLVNYTAGEGFKLVSE